MVVQYLGQSTKVPVIKPNDNNHTFWTKQQRFFIAAIACERKRGRHSFDVQVLKFPWIFRWLVGRMGLNVWNGDYSGKLVILIFISWNIGLSSKSQEYWYTKYQRVGTNSPYLLPSVGQPRDYGSIFSRSFLQAYISTFDVDLIFSCLITTS